MYDELVGNLMAQATHFHFNDETSLLLLKAADAIEDLQKQLRDEKVANVNLTGWLAEEHANKCPHYIRNIQYIGNGSLCDKWECKIASLPKWIPVTEQLPTEHGHYLTACSVIRDDETTSWMQLDFFVNGKFLEDDVGNPKVTHWRPLPQPPESEGA